MEQKPDISPETKVYHFVESANLPGQRGLSCRTTTDPDPDLGFDATLRWEMTVDRLTEISNYSCFWHAGTLYEVRRDFSTLQPAR